MTARWFSARLGKKTETSRPRGVPKSRATAGFPTARGRQSPKVVLISGARDAKRRL
jgi:hypothetical protein